MKRRSLAALAVLLAMQSASAHARKPKLTVEVPQDYVNRDLADDANVWHCWYDGKVSVLCRLGETLIGEAAAPSAAPAVDARLPQIVTQIWHQAAQLTDRVVIVPLHSTPYDMAAAGQLANAVMCGGSRVPCGIIFAANAKLLSGLVDKRRTQLVTRQLNRLALND